MGLIVSVLKSTLESALRSTFPLLVVCISCVVVSVMTYRALNSQPAPQVHHCPRVGSETNRPTETPWMTVRCMATTTTQRGVMQYAVRRGHGHQRTSTTRRRAVGQVSTLADGWYWQRDDGSWQLYGTTNLTIETSYQSNPECLVEFTYGGESHFIDLKVMTQTNCKTGKRRKVMRVDNGIIGPMYSTGTVHTDDAQGSRPVSRHVAPVAQRGQPNIFPRAWGNDDKSLRLVLIDSSGSDAEEYRLVVGLFARTMRSYHVQSVIRIQNRLLYQRFHLNKMQMESRLGRNKGLRYLFHGTMESHIRSICKQGFDCRLHSTHHSYGKGSYFARDASYSRKYTDCEKMFLAEVLVGEYTVGSPDIVRPPIKNDSGDLFDSCVDDDSNPHTFVAFDIAHSYPAYLISYGQTE